MLAVLAHERSRHVVLVQVPIFEILKKYDGVRIHDDIKNGRRRCAHASSPPF